MTYTFPWYWSLFPIAAGIAGLAWSLKEYRLNGINRLVIKRWILGAILALVAAPSFVVDNIEIGNEAVSYTKGFWFAPVEMELRYASIASIRRLSKRSRWLMQQEYWVIVDKEGNTQDLDLGDLWRLHADAIAQDLTARGVVIVQ